MRMLQARGGADLDQEAFAAERCANVWMQHLDGDIPIVLDVVREIHSGHATGTELTLEAVAVGQRRVEARKNTVHQLTFRVSSANQFNTTTSVFCAPASAPVFTK